MALVKLGWESELREAGTLQERRTFVRRAADREPAQRLEGSEATAKGGEASERKEVERERRRTIRRSCKVQIEMMIGHAAGFADSWSVDSLEIKGRILDLSIEGAKLFTQLFTKQILEVGQELRLAIHLPTGATITTNATVRWVKAIPQKEAYMSGVQFVHLTQRDHKKVVGFLKELAVARDGPQGE